MRRETMSYATEQGVLNSQWNAAEAAFQSEMARQLPHVLMRPALTQDGNAWLAIYGDLPTGVVGTGATPAEAMASFDKAWISVAKVETELGEFKPFITYPEDRQKLISLATILQSAHDVETGQKAADELSDLVLEILRDEAVYLEKDDGPTTA